MTSHIGLRIGSGERRTLRCGDGSELDYWVTGTQGSWLLCINAHGQDLLVFRGLVEELAKRHRVVAWKPRGTFEEHATAFSIWDQGQDLGRIIRQERIDRCALITWCAGAKTAVEFARTNPIVCAMVLANGAFTRIPGFEQFETEFDRTLAELCQTVIKKPSLAGMMMSAMRSLLGGMARSPGVGSDGTSGTTDEALKALIAEPFQSPQTTLRYAGQVVNYYNYDISPSLRALDLPVLILAGEQNRVSSPEMARAVADMLPKGRFTQIASGSHYCLYESSVEVAARIEAFLAGVLTTAASIAEVAP